MKFSLTKESLLLRVGGAMASIVLLAVVGMVSSVFMADTSEGYAAAINHAGTLRMQSYRIASSLKSSGDLKQAAFNTRKLADEFEERLYSDRIHNVFSKDISDNVRNTYQVVEDDWRDIMLPMLQEYIGGALAEKGAGYTAGDLENLKKVYLGKVDGFVDKVHAFVRALEDEAEGKIHLLRLIQIVVLVLTFVVVFVILLLMNRDVVKPLNELLVFARRVRQGDFSMRNKPRHEDELGQLGYAFNMMAEDLSKIYQDLEQRVKDKTLDLERSNRSLELLYSTTQQLGENPLTEISLENLIGDIERVIGVRGGAVCLGEPGDKQAYRMATTVEEQKESKHACDMPDCMKCFGDGDTHFVNVEKGDIDMQRYSIPIRDQEQQYGVLLLDLQEDTNLDDWQKRLLETVSRHIAMAIVRARQVSQNRLLSLMEERSIIARELHDSLAQSLSYLKIQVSRLEKNLGEQSNEKVLEITGKLRDGLNSAYRELRELLTTFRLRMTEEGLLRAMEDTVTEFSERGNLRIELNNNIANCIFSPNEEIHMIQIVREALSNIVRHSQSTQAKVSLECNMDGGVQITIEDNGVGMPEVEQLEHHYGMAIMRERTRGLGGSLHVGKSELGGTAVKLFFQAKPSTHA